MSCTRAIDPNWLYNPGGPVGKTSRNNLYFAATAGDGGASGDKDDSVQQASNERLLQIYRGLHGLPRVGRAELKEVDPQRLRKLLKSIGGIPRKRYFDPFLFQYKLDSD